MVQKGIESRLKNIFTGRLMFPCRFCAFGYVRVCAATSVHMCACILCFACVRGVLAYGLTGMKMWSVVNNWSNNLETSSNWFSDIMLVTNYL